MRRELLIAAGPGEWRAALVEDGAAVELYVERGDIRPAGSIHLGRVARHAPGLDSAFVEIGDERPGIVPVREAAADGIRLDEGARVLVQIRREAQPDKGARLSTRIVPRGLDLGTLSARAAAREPPAQLDPAPGLAAALALRVPAPPDRVVADDAAAIPELRATFPAAEIAQGTATDWPFDLDAAIDAALMPSLALPDGGSLHFEEARAAVLIDVDTGNPERGSAARAALAANLAAARVIARQMRLRNLGGGIVIDFVGLDGRGPRERVRQALAAELASDPAQPQVLGWTRLGHLELVRPRRFRSLAAAMLEPGGTGRHATALAHDALRLLAVEARARPESNWRLVVTPAVAAALRGAAAAGLAALERRLGRRIAIETAGESPSAGPRPFDIVAS